MDRGQYLVILTPSNPNYYWGNYLLFSKPPAQGDADRWEALFQQEICSRQPTRHRVFTWDTVNGETGEIQPFIDAGFHRAENLVLTAQQVNQPPKYNQEVQVRPLVEEWEWEAALQNQIDCWPQWNIGEGFITFRKNKMKRYREMQCAGLGEWFGAFQGSRLAADLGLFVIDGIGRFQSVETHPEFRRLGICGALVYQAARYGFERMGAQTLVMIADEHYHAALIYESIGFRVKERQVAVERW